ncbi:hypothetical protein LIA77_02630 [Sarocladium implicatum]|nr:hypothetical protein LIA77_02630 [Sarocladium implicatum]
MEGWAKGGGQCFKGRCWKWRCLGALPRDREVREAQTSRSICCKMSEWVPVGCRVVERLGCVSGNKKRTLAGPHTLYDRGGDGKKDQGVRFVEMPTNRAICAYCCRVFEGRKMW